MTTGTVRSGASASGVALQVVAPENHQDGREPRDPKGETLKNRTNRFRGVLAVVMAVGLGLVFAGPLSAAATVVHTNADVPVHATLPDPCSVDLVTIDGSVHLVTHVTFPKPGNASLGVHLNFKGVKGSGFPSGANYATNGTAELSAKVRGPFPAGFTMPGHFFLLQSGPANDLKVSYLLKGKINGNGTVTDLTIEIRKLECGSFDLI